MSLRDEQHFRMLFEHAPISLWEEDYSGLRRIFDRLRAAGVDDLPGYLAREPQVIEEAMACIRVVDVNFETLRMFGARSKVELIANRGELFRDQMRVHLHDELLALWRGEVSWAGEGINYTVQGEPFDIRLVWRILPGHEETFARVLVAIEDITARKRAERARALSEARLRNLFEFAPISLWEEDYSDLKIFLDQLRQQGVTDLRAYLRRHPEAVDQCMAAIRVLDVNRKTLELFEATSKQELLANLDRVFRDDMRMHFADELVEMWNGKTSYSREGINYALAGNAVDVHLDWRLMPGHEQDFSWVLVAIHDITARKKAEEYMRYLGTHDVMTGLYNRAYFEDLLTALEKDRNDPITVVIADLNGLKATNDSLGHQAGDNLIRRAAEVLRASFEQNYSVARIGGDEFAIVLPGVDEQNVRGMLHRVGSLTAVNNKFYRDPNLSISLGVATSRSAQPLEKVISLADDALYRQKGAYYKRRKGD